MSKFAITAVTLAMSLLTSVKASAPVRHDLEYTALMATETAEPYRGIYEITSIKIIATADKPTACATLTASDCYAAGWVDRTMARVERVTPNLGYLFAAPFAIFSVGAFAYAGLNAWWRRRG